MNKEEFKAWIIEENNYPCDSRMAFGLLCNVLDYAEGMGEAEQYNFLCRMIPQVPERIIRSVAY